MPILTSQEIHDLDARAAADWGIETAWLMDAAGAAVARAVLEVRPRNVWIFCGPGNNGGDGWAAARHLRSAGLRPADSCHGSVTVISPLQVDQWPELPRRHARAARSASVPLVPALPLTDVRPGDVVIDAIFGVGLRRPIGEPWLTLVRDIARARDRGARVWSVDVPSGLDADRHHPIGPHVEADQTLALHALKPCLVQYPTRTAAGRIRVVPIGLPPLESEALRSVIEADDVRRWIPVRSTDTHKGRSGHVLVIAGSSDKPGAARLVCEGALAAGAGLVTLAAPRDVLRLVIGGLPEVMGHPVDRPTLAAVAPLLERIDACVVGPGLDPVEGAEAESLVDLIHALPLPTVVDAEALNTLARVDPSRRVTGPVPRVWTPHPAEAARLLGMTTAEVQSDRFRAVESLAGQSGATAVLKGAGTLVHTIGDQVRVNLTGTPALAVGGSGDVLAGMIGALLAQGLGAAESASAGVFLHGWAGEIAAAGVDRGLRARQIADAVPAAFLRLRSADGETT